MSSTGNLDVNQLSSGHGSPLCGTSSSNGNLDVNHPPSGCGSPPCGTLVPNRIFVGGISSDVSDAELRSLFSEYGNVKSTKIIMDKDGICRGYGFVTFETEEEAQRIQKRFQVDEIVLHDRKLDIAPAIKKQPHATASSDPGQTISNSSVLLHPSHVPEDYNNGAVFSGSDSIYLSQVPYPSVVYPQSIFLPQQYYQAPSGVNFPTQYVFAVPTASTVYAFDSAPPQYSSLINDWMESSSSEASSMVCSSYPVHILYALANPYNIYSYDSAMYYPVVPFVGNVESHFEAIDATTASFQRLNIATTTTAEINYGVKCSSTGRPRSTPRNKCNGRNSVKTSKNRGGGKTTAKPRNVRGSPGPSRKLVSHVNQQQMLERVVGGATLLACPNPVLLNSPTVFSVPESHGCQQTTFLTGMEYIRDRLALETLSVSPINDGLIASYPEAPVM